MKKCSILLEMDICIFIQLMLKSENGFYIINNLLPCLAPEDSICQLIEFWCLVVARGSFIFYYHDHIACILISSFQFITVYFFCLFLKPLDHNEILLLDCHIQFQFLHDFSSILLFMLGPSASTVSCVLSPLNSIISF